jgi:hypothetical protein
MRAIALVALLTAVLTASAAGQESASNEAPLITGTPEWIERPTTIPHPPGNWWTRTDLPKEALVVLDCLVAPNGRLDCSIQSEEPPGWDFGQQALRLARDLRMAPTTREGEPTANRRHILRIPFRTE